MALKKPIISTDCKTGPREILLSDEEYDDITKRYPNGASVKDIEQGAYGILVPNMDEQENLDPTVITEEEKVLAKALELLLGDDELSEHYAQKALERAMLYTPDRYADNLREIFERNN